MEIELAQPTKPDRRVERTRQAVLVAFRELMLQRGYDRVGVGEIITRANVGRSTFYEHFENKDDLLRQSLTPLLEVLATTVGAAQPPEALARVVGHFWENRRLTRALLHGSARALMARYATELVEEHVARLARNARAARPLVPPRLIAAQIAEGQLALIAAWLAEKMPCSADVLARALHRSTTASAAALLAHA